MTTLQPSAGYSSELQGTREDLAAFLRSHRRKLRLKRSDVWEWDGITTHTFTAPTAVFKRHGMTRKTRVFDFTVTPF